MTFDLINYRDVPIPILLVELSEMSDETKQRLSVRKLSVASQAGLGYQLLKPVVWALLTAVLGN